MTSPASIRLFTAIAAIGKSSDVEEFIDWIQLTEREDILRVFSRIRSRVRNLEVDVVDYERYTRPSRSVKDVVYVRDILRLQAESGISATAAANRISSVLTEREKSLEIPKFSQKEGLQRWLLKIANIVGENLLLSAAIDAIGPSRSVSDWTLS